MARPEEKALRLTMVAAFFIVIVFAIVLYVKQPGRKEAEQTAQQDQTLIDTVQNSSPTQGTVGAPVTIAEFSDFQCPFCKNVAPLIDRAMKEYPGKIHRVWIFVTNVADHPESESAAVAAYCAHKQGKFWEFKDKLFEAQDNLNVTTYNQITQNLRLDSNLFHACIANSDSLRIVRSHTQFAQRAGVTETPYVTVNNLTLSGEFTWDQLKNAIDKSMK